jgi:hypothetical protein
MVFGSWRLCSWVFSAHKTARASAATSFSMSLCPPPRCVRPVAGSTASLSSPAYFGTRGDGRAGDGGLGADPRGQAGGQGTRARERKRRGLAGCPATILSDATTSAEGQRYVHHATHLTHGLTRCRYHIVLFVCTEPSYRAPSTLLAFFSPPPSSLPPPPHHSSNAGIHSL